jgi:hypothetical protein
MSVGEQKVYVDEAVLGPWWDQGDTLLMRISGGDMRVGAVILEPD